MHGSKVKSHHNTPGTASGIEKIKESNGIAKVALDFKKKFLRHFPKERDDHFFHHTYSYRAKPFLGLLAFYTDLYEYLDLSHEKTNDLRATLYDLDNPTSNRTKEKFKLTFKHFILLLNRTDPQITKRLKKLNLIECLRLEEAMDCLGINCNLASVVMAVSAVEYRLHKLIAKKNKKVYENTFENQSLGGLIGLFRKNSQYKGPQFDKLRQVLPERHMHLMEILNMYRIFSAHPKDIHITHQLAKAILSFSFLLLVDPELAIEIV